MTQAQGPVTAAAEAAVLQQVEVRLITPAEQARWEQLVTEHHYLKSALMVGEQLRYVAEVAGQWVALLGWCAAAYHLKGRDAWLGWDANQRRARLGLLANNARFCVLADRGRWPNLASRVLALNLQRLAADWEAAYGHPVLVVESFVDTQLFRGTAYAATGWWALGCTAGFRRVAEDFYVPHDRPKQLFVRELVKHAARTLRRRRLPPALAAHERPLKPRCLVGGGELRSLRETLAREVPESRDARGLRHTQATVLAIAFAFLLSGGQGGHRAVALFAKDLSPTQRALLDCWFNARTKQYDVPTENCVYRVLRAVPVRAFQQAVWGWQQARLGGATAAWWCSTARPCGAAAAPTWSTQSTPGAGAPWGSSRWPPRATRFPPPKPCWSGWTWRAPLASWTPCTRRRRRPGGWCRRAGAITSSLSRATSPASKPKRATSSRTFSPSAHDGGSGARPARMARA